MRIYLDSAPVIYTVEYTTPFVTAIDTRLAAPGVVRISSELARLECLVRPHRDDNEALVRDFEDYFATQVTELVSFTRTVFRRATLIRARENFKTPDALHLAAALEAECDVFLTNDRQLTRFRGITVEVV